MGLNGAGLKLSERSLEIWRQIHASNPVVHSTALGNYGYDLIQAGKPELARQPLQDSQRQLEHLLPADDEAVAVGRLLTAIAHFALWQPQEAVDLFRLVATDAEAGSEAHVEAVEFLAHGRCG